MTTGETDDALTVAAPATDSLAGRLLGGRYLLGEILGQGAAGHVYLAIQQPLGRRVAVKVLRSDIDPHTRNIFGERFLREAALAGRLNHPNLVTVHDYGVDDGAHYLVMEYLEGRTLSRALPSGTPMPARKAAEIGVGLAAGLRHAHQAGLVHRDVKPSNVMLVADDDGIERPKLMDFGLVKDPQEDTLTTQAGHYLGTPAYMAPEQSRLAPVDGRTDLYALGVLLYRAFTGRLPFEAPNAVALALMHQTEPVPPMSAVNPGVVVPVALELAVARAMEKDPMDRFADVGELAQALQRWIDDVDGFPAPVVTGPPRAPRRRRMPWWLATALGGAAVLGGTVVMAAGVVGMGLAAMGIVADRGAEPSAVEAPRPPEGASAVPVPLADPVPDAVPSVTAPPAPAAPRPAPAPRPAAVPRPAAAPRPVPVAPRPTPAAPRPAPASDGIEVDGVSFDEASAARTVTWVNAATPDQLEAAGVYDRGIGVILSSRPFDTIEAFGQTKGIGNKTVDAVARGANP